MPNYNKGGITEAPGQVTEPGSASKGYTTDIDGKIYPDERKTSVQDYMSMEGSMGFERNQGVTRDSDEISNPEILNMGQHKLQKLREGECGSHAIGSGNLNK